MFSRRPDPTPLLRYRRKRRGPNGAEDAFEITIPRWFVTLIASVFLMYALGVPAVPTVLRIAGL